MRKPGSLEPLLCINPLVISLVGRISMLLSARVPIIWKWSERRRILLSNHSFLVRHKYPGLAPLFCLATVIWFGMAPHPTKPYAFLRRSFSLEFLFHFKLLTPSPASTSCPPSHFSLSFSYFYFFFFCFICRRYNCVFPLDKCYYERSSGTCVVECHLVKVSVSSAYIVLERPSFFFFNFLFLNVIF